MLCKYIPRELIGKLKHGFDTPISERLLGLLRGWTKVLLGERHLKQREYFDPGTIRHKWQEYLLGKGDWRHHLWNVSLFQGWLEAPL